MILCHAFIREVGKRNFGYLFERSFSASHIGGYASGAEHPCRLRREEGSGTACRDGVGFANAQAFAGVAETGSETTKWWNDCKKTSPHRLRRSRNRTIRTLQKTKQRRVPLFCFFAIAIFQFNCVAVVLAKISLSLNSAAAAALYESVHFIDRHAVEVAFDCVFQA